jgi:hypothetical protein
VITTSLNDSFVLNAWKILGDALSISLVMVMVECMRLPVGKAVVIGVSRTTLMRWIWSDISSLLMGPCLEPLIVMYASIAATAGTADNSAEITPQSTINRLARDVRIAILLEISVPGCSEAGRLSRRRQYIAG